MISRRRVSAGAAGLLVVTVCAWAQAAQPRVIVAELDGIIQPISAEYLTDAIDKADTSAADLVVFILRTPGGLLDATRTIVSRMITSRAPVVVFVGPSGGRAASAGFVVTMAADIAVMAPGTHIGAAHPVSGTGQQMDDVSSKKAASDAAAYVRSLTAARGRNAMLAEAAVLESRSFTDAEARTAMPPLVDDIVAADVPDLLRKLDGRIVTRFDGRKTTLHTAGAVIVGVPMTVRQQFLGAIADPQIAYLLLTLGTLGLTVELWMPGAILPGVAGGLCLLLAFFAFQILSVSATGVALVVFGIGLLILELKVPSFGALGIGGTVSLVIGSMMVTRQVPGVVVGLDFILPVALVVAAGILLLGRLALRAQRQKPVTGRDGLVGRRGRVRTPLAPATPGTVDVHGEIWQAISDVPVGVGEFVRVAALDGLTLTVVPDRPPVHEGAPR